MKNVLVLWYSQSGQLKSVIDQILEPLKATASIQVCELALEPESPFPYPWSFWTFLDAFPETATLSPAPNKPLNIPADSTFDLVLLGYPAWFLSPPPALTAFLQSDQARQLLANTPVITVTACRNMWLMAQQDVKSLLAQNHANHIDHIALTDQGGTFATFITTPRWLLTGKKNAFWKFPAAGVAPQEIESSKRFGIAIRDALTSQTPLQNSVLQGLGACVVDERLIASETVGKRSFKIWGALLRRLGKPGTFIRRVGLGVYLCFLICLIITVLPITILIKKLLRPLLAKKLQQMKHDLEQPSGSSTHNIRPLI